MIIIGAGLAGLLAGQMLRRYNPLILEAQNSLPNNHAALLRFRSDKVSRVTGIPFKEVSVNKLIKWCNEFYTQPNLFFGNMYSQKVSGKIHGRSILNLEPVTRYIAPDNFVEQLSLGLNIQFGIRIKDIEELQSYEPPYITTIPMPFTLKLINQERFRNAEVSASINTDEFKHKSILSIRTNILDPFTDVYQTIYYPGGYEDYYRASITGNHFIMEYICQSEEEIQAPKMSGAWGALAEQVLCNDFGIDTVELPYPEIKFQEFGKLVPIDDMKRKQFILAMSDKHQIYSLGRFATWRQILLDDIVHDVDVIDSFITNRSNYQRNMHYQ